MPRTSHVYAGIGFQGIDNLAMYFNPPRRQRDKHADDRTNRKADQDYDRAQDQFFG